MDTISRRHILIGAAGTAASAVLPALPSLALTAHDSTPDDLEWAQELLADLQLEHTTASLYETLAETGRHWAWEWEQSYTKLVAIGDELRGIIRDDTPAARTILRHADAIYPPACIRAETYWQPIPDLSRRFRKASKHYYGLRAKWLDLRGDMTPELYNAWSTVIGETVQLDAKTSGDRELQRRILQSYGHDDLLDMAYLRERRSSWQSYIHDTFSTRCGALPCRRCAQWFA